MWIWGLFQKVRSIGRGGKRPSGMMRRSEFDASHGEESRIVTFLGSAGILSELQWQWSGLN